MSQKLTVTEHLQSTNDALRLEDVLDYIDTLHSVASDGEVSNIAETDAAEMMNVLRDIIYTAQETIVELETVREIKRQRAKRQQPALRIVPKVEKAG